MIHILSVDDEPIHQFVIKEFLSNSYELSFVDSGENCLKHLCLVKPDIILMDICLPGINGLETSKKIRNTFGYDKTPIIFLSTLEYSSCQQNIQQVNGYYISKPFNKELLVKLINKVSQIKK